MTFYKIYVIIDIEKKIEINSKNKIGGKNELIESFEKIKVSNSSISYFELTLLPKDTLVVKFDQDIWDIDSASQIIECIKKLYPENNIMAIFKGMELGVIHNVD